MDVNEKLTNNLPGTINLDDYILKEDPFLGEKIGTISRREEKEIARKARKKRSLRHRKPYTRKKGTVHPKKKEATKRRQRRDRWNTDPFWCTAYGHGYHSLDRKLWDRHIAPFWVQYDPKDLSIVRYKGYGRKHRPYTVWTLKVVHSVLGELWDGNDALLYSLS